MLINNQIIVPKYISGGSGRFQETVLTPQEIGAYSGNNPSGFITGVDLSNYITKTNGQFINRPTVNGTGVLLNGEAAEYIFPNNLAVSLSSGKTFGRYINGQIIPASGKTPSQVIELALVEPITPNVTLTSSSPAIQFNQTGINNILSGNATINSLGASVQTGYIEWRRGGVGAWLQLTGNTLSSFSFTHSLIDSNFNSSGFNYRYIVVDTVGASGTGFANITPIAYAAPSLSSTSVDTSPVDLGNISGTLSTTINRNSQNVNVTGYQLQYQTGITWVNIGSLTPISNTPHPLSVIHNDSSLRNMSSINYRIQVFDQFQSNTITMGSRSFLYRNYLGYNTGTSLTLAEIEALTNSQLSNSKVRTVPSVTAPDNFYTYYCYRAGDGDLSNIVQAGIVSVLTAFTKLSDVNGTNAFGASVTYRVYKSNSTKAFTSVSLAFS